MATQIFKKGDRVRLIYDHSYSGTVTKTQYVPKRGISSGDFQWLWLDNSNTPVGVTSENFELEPSQITDREKAMEWWNRLIGLERGIKFLENRNQGSLTGREVEQIWRKETQNSLDRPMLMDGVSRYKMKTYKCKGLNYYVINAHSKEQAALALLHYKVGVTEDDLEEYNGKPMGLDCKVFDYSIIMKPNDVDPKIKGTHSHLITIDEQKVDFEMLKKILDKEICYRQVGMDEEELDNLKLMINKLSQSSSFAHKAHKELQKLLR